MASVTGITAERAQEIWNASVVSGEVSSDGKLLLKTRGGTILDGGSIALPSVSKSWPVGSIFMSVSPTNPNTSLGVGTWVAWGTGRVPVGVSSSDAEFDSVEETGGSKTVTLTPSQVPALSAESAGLHSHGPGSLDKFLVTDRNSSPGKREAPAIADSTYVSAFNGADSVDVTSTTTSSGTHTHTVNSGGGGSHPNLQPYITCYMWKRTA